MINIKAYETEHGVCFYEKFLDSIKDKEAKSRVLEYVQRMERGLLGNSKSVGSGVQEVKIQVGEGFRVYYYRDGQELIILLGGSNKKKQEQEIKNAKSCLVDYKRRKKNGDFNEIRK